MNDFQNILAEIKDLRKRVERLESENKRLSVSQIEYFESLSPTSVVDKTYTAWRFGISESAVVRGRGGTASLAKKRLPGKALRWKKRDVDAAFAQMSKPVKVLAAEFASAAKPVRRRSVVKQVRESL